MNDNDENLELKSIGLAIKEGRAKYSYTQEKLAEKVGISIKTMGRIEKGRQQPGLPLFRRICTELNLSVDAVFYPEDMPKVSSLRRQVMVSIAEEMHENELMIIQGTIEGIIKGRKKKDKTNAEDSNL